MPSLLRGDPLRIRQVLVNLIGNAIKFTREGEVSVVVTVENEQDAAAALRFVVRDTGVGIPKDRQESVFESFTQADGLTTRNYGGTGTGLTICRQIVELMGGEIVVDSVEESGSSFWFTATVGRQEGSPTPGFRIPDAMESAKVLIVDDNKTNRFVLREILKSLRCKQGEAANGPDALIELRRAAAAGEPYEIAVLDMEMPGMDGAMLGTEIKSDLDLRTTELIRAGGFNAGCGNDGARRARGPRSLPRGRNGRLYFQTHRSTAND